MRRSIVFGMLALAGVLVALGLLSRPQTNRPTVESPRPAGLRALYLYLERRGAPVEIWKRSSTELGRAQRGTLVVAAPFTVGYSDEETAALNAWVSRGNRLVLLVSSARPWLGDDALHEALGLVTERESDEAPLSWAAWQRWAKDPVVLERAPQAPDDLPETLHATRGTWRVTRPGGATSLYVDAEGAPAVFRIPRNEGELVVVNDSSVFGNDRLGEAGNLELAHRLLIEPLGEGERLYVDEWRHGFREAGAIDGPSFGAFEALAAHVVLLYALFVWRLAKRFGPRMRAAGVGRGSVERDLLALADLHRRSKHARASAERMLAAARRLGAGKDGCDELPARPRGGDESDLVELARRIGTLQNEGRL